MTPTVPGSTAVALATVGLSCLLSGAALLLVRRAMLSGALLVAAGLVGLAGAVLTGTGATMLSWTALVGAWALLLPLALTTYPRHRWRHPVDLVALCVVLGSGVLVVVQPTDSSAVGPLGVVLVTTMVLHTWWRLERTDGDERRALQWMALAVGTSLLLGALLVFAWEGTLVSRVAIGLLAVIGPALYVGAAAAEVIDVRGAVVGAMVTVLALLTYLAVFVGLATMLELTGGTEPEVGALAVVGALAALTLQPLRVVLRGVVDQLLFGTRPDPLDAAHELAGHIGDDPVLALRAIRSALVLPYASLRVDGVELAASGVASPHTHPVVVDARAQLVVGLRAGDLTMSRGDLQVLDLAAPLLAQALHARALVEELHLARERTVAAIAEERRRLRRDLHDGLGPRLSGIAFTSDAARNLLRVDPDAADALLRTLRAETATAIEDIRGLVYAMRPPALDELGLVGALRQQAVGLRSASGESLSVSVEGPQDLSSLPAAVEVAAYRIVGEALANVGRHSASPGATVSLRLEDAGLRVCVQDAGSGTGTWRAGVGMSSMRDRASELGGTLRAGPTRTGGHVEAFLPVG